MGAFGSQSFSFSPDINELWYESEPTAGLYDVFRRLGVGGTSPLGKFIRGSQPRYYSSYLSQLPQEPNLNYREFLRRLNPELEFGGQGPRERGINPTQSQPRLRWLYNR